MDAKVLVVTPAERNPALNALGAKVTVLASIIDTNGYAVTFQQGGTGIGPPPHSHDWAESFYVLKGTVEFTCAGKTTQCAAGTFVHVPPGAVHSFHFTAGGGEMLELTGQGSLAPQMFTALNDEISPGLPDMAQVLAVLEQNGVTVTA